MTKHEQTRLTQWRMKVLRHANEVTQNVSRTCRHFGISRQSFYKWHRRYEKHGETGLCDRPRRPHRSPRSTAPEVVSKILYLRQNYHFGPHKMGRLPANQKHRRHERRWKRYEKQQPGHRLQVDVKFLERIPLRHARHPLPRTSSHRAPPLPPRHLPPVAVQLEGGPEGRGGEARLGA